MLHHRGTLSNLRAFPTRSFLTIHLSLWLFRVSIAIVVGENAADLKNIPKKIVA
jgi:hypothetical protein